MVPFSLTAFGQYCREFRTRGGYTLLDQERALHTPMDMILSIEEGRAQASSEYVESLAYWLRLNEAERSLLLTARRLRRGTHLSSRQVKRRELIFNELPTMSATSIRGLRRRIELGDANDV